VCDGDNAYALDVSPDEVEWYRRELRRCDVLGPFRTQRQADGVGGGHASGPASGDQVMTNTDVKEAA